MGLEIADGAAIFAGFIIVYLLAVTYGLYTRRGSAIDEHPYGNQYDAASSARSNLISGREGIANWTRGTR
jgi:hypothetical protein